ncbi:MAG: hypothetical protein WAM99_21155, partial [Xanthobacteraceae bacterium]
VANLKPFSTASVITGHPVPVWGCPINPSKADIGAPVLGTHPEMSDLRSGGQNLCHVRYDQQARIKRL